MFSIRVLCNHIQQVFNHYGKIVYHVSFIYKKDDGIDIRVVDITLTCLGPDHGFICGQEYDLTLNAPNV